MSVAAEILMIARWFVYERGFSVIPLDHPAETTQTDPRRIGKVPVLSSWKAFQTARATDDNLQAWFGNGRRRNIAIVTGAVSDIVVIDCDADAAVGWADRHLPPTPMRTRTAKGEHRAYRYPDQHVPNKVRLRTGDPAIKIDVRGDGGYVVAPGSVHATGVVYERLGDWPPVNELPVFDPAWLGDEQQAAQRAPLMNRRPGAVDRASNRDRVMRRARKYLDAAPRAIEGQGGDLHTYQVVCRIVRGFDLVDADARAAARMEFAMRPAVDGGRTAREDRRRAEIRQRADRRATRRFPTRPESAGRAIAADLDHWFARAAPLA